MANYYAYVRTNYFHVKDAAAFREFIASIGSTEGDKVELIEGDAWMPRTASLP